MDGTDPARISANPGDRIRACLQASAHVELQHDGRLRILRQYFNGAFTLDRSELTFVVVIASLQSSGFKLIGGRI